MILQNLNFEENLGQYFWYISKIKNLKQGDFVLAPFGPLDELKKAKVIRVDKNVNGQTAPLPIKRLKTIFKKI